jgi:hypothetical protein
MSFDVILNFFSAFYDKGQIITDKKLIAKQYFSKHFFLDIYAIVLLILDSMIDLKQILS